MKGKTMSKIFEALENAEKERVRKGSAPFPEPKAEKKTELVVGPKEEKKTAPILGPREEKLGRPGESAQEQRATELRKGFTPAPEPREEKKTLPVLEPKSERMERPAPTAAPEPREVKKTPPVARRKNHPCPGEAERGKTRKSGEARWKRFLSCHEPKEEKRIPPVRNLKKTKENRLWTGAEERRRWKTTMIHHRSVPDKMGSSTP
jgi:hypothetical protein